jgi:hypothetical protein
MHSAQAPRAKRPVRKQTRDQQCVGGEQIVRQRVRGSERDNNADQSNNGQANADHGGRDRENMDANYPAQGGCLHRVAAAFLLSCDHYLDRSRKQLFRELRGVGNEQIEKF